MVLMSFVGIGHTIFEFNNLVYGESVGTEGVGAVSPNAVYARADSHIILDRRGIFVYQGGLTVNSISNDIFSGTFDDAGDVDTDQIDKEFIFFMDKTNELYCFYTELNASSPGTFPDKALILNMDSGIWRKRKFPIALTFASAREGGEGIRIIDLTGTIAEQSWTIGAGSATGANPVIMLGSESPLSVYEYDFVSAEDDGSAIPWFHRTKELSAYDRTQRLDQVEIVYRGTEATIKVRGDDGLFADYATIPATGQLTRFVTDEAQIVRNVVQLEISGTGGCEIGSISVLRKEESRHGL